MAFTHLLERLPCHDTDEDILRGAGFVDVILIDVHVETGVFQRCKAVRSLVRVKKTASAVMRRRQSRNALARSGFSMTTPVHPQLSLLDLMTALGVTMRFTQSAARRF
jgi:hypothetical protein